MRQRRIAPWIALLLSAALAGCQCNESSPSEAEPPQAEAPLPDDIWSYVGRAPAWIHIDVAALRADARAARLWDMAEAADEEHPLRDAISKADALAIAWRDAGFSHRINVVSGPIEGNALRDGTLADGFTSYTAGRTEVWTRAGSPWAVSVPRDRLMVTGTPEAVRAAVASPCGSCEQTAASTITARLTVLDLHRTFAGAVLETPALTTVLRDTDQIDAQINLSLGLDIAVDVTLVRGRSADALALLIGESLAALRASLPEDESAMFARGVLERIDVTPTEEKVSLTVELSREEVDRLAEVIGGRLAPTAPINAPDAAADSPEPDAPTPAVDPTEQDDAPDGI